ncbi:hypothetical protein HDE_08436 [Halotydeus destructor]|nr:hypothetical protein HDE_08436 [Halotydeus destructor]
MIFCEHLNKMDFDEKKVKKELYMKVRSMRGLTAGIVPPDLVVTYITKQYIGKLVDPIKDTMRAVDDIMQQLIKELIKVCSGYPTLMIASMRAMKKQLRQCIDKTHRQWVKQQKQNGERRESAETVPQISIDKLYEAFLYLMNISKKKYQEHIRKIICFNTIVCFQKYVETGMFYDVLKCEGDVKKLMARSSDSQARIANLKAEVDACSKALELIDNLVIY